MSSTAAGSKTPTKPPLFAKTEATGNLNDLHLWLSGQKDILVSYLVHFGGLSERVEDVRLGEIDDHGISLTYKPSSGKDTETARIDFPKPLPNWSAARKTLLAMRDEAAKALAVRKQPAFGPYRAPPFFPENFIVACLLLFQFLTLIAKPTSPYLSWFASLRENHLPGGATFVRYSYVLLIAVHVLEALWLIRKLSKTGAVTSPADLRRWGTGTLVFGLVGMYPHYLRELQQARIDSIWAVAESKKTK